MIVNFDYLFAISRLIEMKVALRNFLLLIPLCCVLVATSCSVCVCDHQVRHLWRNEKLFFVCDVWMSVNTLIRN
jgi:cell division protein FtsL